MSTSITLGIFDDHPFFTKGLRDFLEPFEFIRIAFSVHTRPELELVLSEKLPDILIMDVLAPDVNGLDLYLYTRKLYDELKIIAYTSLRSEILIDSLLTLGVRGYVNKNQPPGELLEAIKDVHYDLLSVPEEFKHLIPEFTSLKTIFTVREEEIMNLIARGETSDAIAKKLMVSLRTIENIKVNLFKKLKVSNAAELILAATRLGYLS